MNHATEIIPDLWIGNKNCIEDLVFLSENQFKCIINCTKDIEYNKNYTKTENIRIVINNSNIFEDNKDMYNRLTEIIKYIHHYLSQNKSVLIFCQNGRQISPTIMAAYIIQYGKVSVKQAVEYIRSKREECFIPDVHFYMALQKFYL